LEILAIEAIPPHQEPATIRKLSSSNHKQGGGSTAGGGRGGTFISSEESFQRRPVGSAISGPNQLHSPHRTFFITGHHIYDHNDAGNHNTNNYMQNPHHRPPSGQDNAVVSSLLPSSGSFSTGITGENLRDTSHLQHNDGAGMGTTSTTTTGSGSGSHAAGTASPSSPPGDFLTPSTLYPGKKFAVDFEFIPRHFGGTGTNVSNLILPSSTTPVFSQQQESGGVAHPPPPSTGGLGAHPTPGGGGGGASGIVSRGMMAQETCTNNNMSANRGGSSSCVTPTHFVRHGGKFVMTLEQKYSTRTITVEVNGSSTRNPYGLPEYILLRPSMDPLDDCPSNEGGRKAPPGVGVTGDGEEGDEDEDEEFNYEAYAHDGEGFVEGIGNYGEIPLEFGLDLLNAKSELVVKHANLTSIKGNFWEAFIVIRMKMEPTATIGPDGSNVTTPLLLWRWRELEELAVLLDDYDDAVRQANLYAALLEQVKAQVDGGVVRWGELRVETSRGDVCVIEIRADLSEFQFDEYEVEDEENYTDLDDAECKRPPPLIGANLIDMDRVEELKNLFHSNENDLPSRYIGTFGLEGDGFVSKSPPSFSPQSRLRSSTGSTTTKTTTSSSSSSSNIMTKTLTASSSEIDLSFSQSSQDGVGLVPMVTRVSTTSDASAPLSSPSNNGTVPQLSVPLSSSAQPPVELSVNETLNLGTLYVARTSTSGEKKQRGSSNTMSVIGDQSRMSSTSDTFYVGVQNRDSTSVQVLNVEQIDFTFQTLEEDSYVAPSRDSCGWSGGNPYLKISIPSSSNTILISPKETVTQLFTFFHSTPPESGILTGIIRISTNHFNPSLANVDIKYELRVLHGTLDMDFVPELSEDPIDPAFATQSGKHIVPAIWWNSVAPRNDILWARQTSGGWNHPAANSDGGVSSSTIPSQFRATTPDRDKMMKKISFQNRYPVPVTIQDIRLSEECQNVANLAFFPHLAQGKIKYKLYSEGDGAVTPMPEKNRPVASVEEWGTMEPHRGTWSGYAHMELFPPQFLSKKITSAGPSNHASVVDVGHPFVCSLVVQTNITTYALPIVLFDEQPHYSASEIWNADAVPWPAGGESTGTTALSNNQQAANHIVVPSTGQPAITVELKASDLVHSHPSNNGRRKKTSGTDKRLSRRHTMVSMGWRLMRLMSDVGSNNRGGVGKGKGEGRKNDKVNAKAAASNNGGRPNKKDKDDAAASLVCSRSNFAAFLDPEDSMDLEDLGGGTKNDYSYAQQEGPKSYLKIDLGSLRADGAVHTSSFYITNLNPVPLRLESSCSHPSMKLEVFRHHDTKQKHQQQQLSKNYNKSFEVNVTDLPQQQTLQQQQQQWKQHPNIHVSPMIRHIGTWYGQTAPHWRRSFSVSPSVVGDIWERLYHSHAKTLGHHQMKHNGTDSNSLLNETMARMTAAVHNESATATSSSSRTFWSLDEYLESQGCDSKVRTKNKAMKRYTPSDTFAPFCTTPFLFNADNGQAYVMGSSSSSSSQASHESSPLSSWNIPPGGVAKIKLHIRTPRSDLLATDMAPFLGFGLKITNVALQQETPLLISFDAIRAHLLLSQSDSTGSTAPSGSSGSSETATSQLRDKQQRPNPRTTNSSNHIMAPEVWFSDSGARNAFGNSLPGTYFQLRSTFSKPVQVQTLQAPCSNLFEFSDLTTSQQPVTDGTSSSSAAYVRGNVKLLLKCTYHVPDMHSEQYTHMYNMYACSHFWLLVRSRIKACQASLASSEPVLHIMNKPLSDLSASRDLDSSSDAEQELLTRTTKLAEELMFAMRERYRGFYRDIQMLLESNVTAQRQESARGRGLSSTWKPHTNTALSPEMIAKKNANKNEDLSLADRRRGHRGDLAFWEAATMAMKKARTVSLPALHDNIITKVENFMSMWEEGSREYGWDHVEDEVTVSAAIARARENDVFGDGHGHQAPAASFPDNVTVHAHSEEVLNSSKTGAAATLSRSKVYSSFVMPRVAGTNTLRFYHYHHQVDSSSERSFKSTTTTGSTTPVGEVAKNYLVIQNPTAVPMKVRLSTINKDGVLFDLAQDGTRRRSTTRQKFQSNVSLQIVNTVNGNSVGSLLSSATHPSSSAATRSWWSGGSYYSYSTLDPYHLLQSSHNITIRSAGGTHVSLLNPSMQTTNSLSLGCGKRCALRSEAMSTDRLESVLGAISSRKVKWVHENSGSGIARPAAFALPFQASEEKIVPPFGMIKVGPILFRPPTRGEFHGTIAVENSLTGVDKVDLVGVSGVEDVTFISWKSEDDSRGYDEFMPPFRQNFPYYRPRPDPYATGVSNIETRFNHPSLIFTGSAHPHTHAPLVKTVHLVNTGDLPLDIERVSLGSGEIHHFTNMRPHPRDKDWLNSRTTDGVEGCEYQGFRLLSCITPREKAKRARNFETGWLAPLRRWLVNIQKLDPHQILPYSDENVADGFVLEPGQTKTLYIAHVADCTYTTFFATLNIHYRGRSMFTSPYSTEHEHQFRQSFKKHKESLLVGYEMRSPSAFDKCHIAKPRAQGVIFTKSGRDPIGMHVKGTYPITYYAADTLFNRLAAGHHRNRHKEQHIDLFIYTASMFFEHSAVALLVSMAFLLLVHAVFYLMDRLHHSKTFRTMWRQNGTLLRYSVRDWLKGNTTPDVDTGWRSMLTMARVVMPEEGGSSSTSPSTATSSSSHAHADGMSLNDVEQLSRDIVKSSVLSRLKTSAPATSSSASTSATTSATTTITPNNNNSGGLSLACIHSNGAFVPRTSRVLSSNNNTAPYCPERRVQLTKRQSTLSQTIFQSVDLASMSSMEDFKSSADVKLPAGLDWRAAAAANIFSPSSAKNFTINPDDEYAHDHPLRRSRIRELMTKRLNNGGASSKDDKETGAQVDYEIHFKNDDTGGMMEIDNGNDDDTAAEEESAVSDDEEEVEEEQNISSEDNESNDGSSINDDSDEEEDDEDQVLNHIANGSKKKSNKDFHPSWEHRRQMIGATTTSNDVVGPSSPRWHVQRRSTVKREIAANGKQLHVNENNDKSKEQSVNSEEPKQQKVSVPLTETTVNNPTGNSKISQAKKGGIATARSRGWEQASPSASPTPKMPKALAKRRVVTR
jgi:hypothetical protein